MSRDEHCYRQQAAALFREAGKPISDQIIEYLKDQQETNKRDETLVELLVGFILIEWFNDSNSFQDLNEKCEKNYSILLGSVVSVVELMRSVSDEEKIPERWKGLFH